MDEVKLLPCPMPWCAKSKPELMQGGFKNGSFVVRCKTCGCETPRFYDPRFAISKWNTRAALTRPPIVTDEVVERVARAICDHTRELSRYDDLDDHQRTFWRDHARAALAAMPTIDQDGGE